MAMQPSATTSSTSSCWRDWIGEADLLQAMWPKLLASHAPPALLQSLLGTCRRTRDMALHEAPHAKLTLYLTSSPTIPPPGPLLRLKQSSRTKPTTLALLNRLVNEPVIPPRERPLFPPPPPPPPVPPHVASMQVQKVIRSFSSPGCSTTITRLTLCGVLVDQPLLEAMQGLPCLTHLDLQRMSVPPPSPHAAAPYLFDSSRLPRHLHTLNINANPLQDNRQAQEDTYTSLLSAFLKLDTITDLELTTSEEGFDDNISTGHYHLRVLCYAMLAVTAQGGAARALRRLCVPCVLLDDGVVESLRRGTLLLEDLEVYGPLLDCAEQQTTEVTWRVLRASGPHLNHLLGLPLGGTAGDLEIHVKRALGCSDSDRVQPAVAHLLASRPKRRVRLVDACGGGSTFVWDPSGGYEPLGRIYLRDALSVLQLSKEPVTRIDLMNLVELHPNDLIAALRPLPTVTQIKIQLDGWDGDWHGRNLPRLLALLPLHVERVFLIGENSPGDLEVFKSMLVNASKVPARQAHPLRVCILALGPGSDVWDTVGRCSARGAMGVMMEEAWCDELDRSDA